VAISSDAKKALSKLPQAAQDFITSQSYGGNLTSGEVSKFYSTWNAAETSRQQKSAALDAKAPDFLKNDPSYQKLTADQKEIAIYNYEVQKSNNQQKIDALNKALEMATAQADPYWRQVIRIAQMEVSNGLADIQGDFAAQNENIKNTIKYIQEDLATNKGNISLEQQAEIASLAADLTDRQKTFELNMGKLGAQKASQLDALELTYSKNIDDIQRNTDFTQEEKTAALDKINRDFTVQRENLVGQAADAGMTFSTKRKIAEQRLAEDNKGLVESTQRQYNNQLAQLEVDRNFITAQKGQQTGNIEQDFQFNTEQQRQAQETAARLIQEHRDKVQRQYSAQIAELETGAARGDTQAQAQLADLQRKLRSSLASAGLAAEKYLGSENLPTGAPSIGGVTGQIYEDKTKDIAQRQDAIYGDLTQRSLNYQPL